MDVKAPMVGKIMQLMVQVGQRVQAEEEVLVIESMKMEIPVSAPHAGTVGEVRVGVGQIVQAGDVLLVLA